MQNIDHNEPRKRKPRSSLAIILLNLSRVPVFILVWIWSLAAWIVATVLIICLFSVLLMWAITQDTPNALRHLTYFGLPLVGVGLVHFFVGFFEARFQHWVSRND